MTVTYCPYTSRIKKMRYLFMAEHMPEQLQELRKQGMRAMDAYMNEVQAEYGRTMTQYIQDWTKTHEHLKKPDDWEPWFRGLKMAELMAEEVAIREVVEAL